MSAAPGPAAGRRYDDIRVGEVCEFSRAITAADMDAYAALAGDASPLPFGVHEGGPPPPGPRVAHGLLAAQLSTLVGMHLPGRYGVYVAQELRFLRSVGAGETVRVRGEVIDKTDALRLLTLKTEIFTERAELAVTGTAKVMVQEPFQEAPPEGQPVDLSLSGKVALVSGASRGIGAATAVLLVRHGARVAVNYHKDEPGARAVVDRIRSFGGVAVAVQADVSQAEDVDRMLEVTVRALGPVDVLVNNASPELRPQPFVDTTWDEYQRHLDVTLKGAFHCVRGVVSGMAGRGGGSIVNVVTTAAMGAPPGLLGAYVTAKVG